MDNDILDPRGTMCLKQLALSPRKSLEQLRNKGNILFYNNTKVEFCNYFTILPTIKEQFRRSGIHNFTDYRRTVRGLSTSELVDLAQELAQLEPDGAIIALADMGVSPASTILGIELEKLGVPTVIITASPGAELAKATAYYQAGRLCFCQIDVYQGTPVESIQKQLKEAFPRILNCLSADESTINLLATLDFALDQTVFASGVLEDLTAELAMMDPDQRDEAGQEYFAKHYLTDGLPIVLPTRRRVHRMLNGLKESPDTVIAAEIGPAGANITVNNICTNAVMAGCKPEYMPIILAAFRAMSQPRYNFLQSVTTSHPGGNMVLVSGPMSKEIGVWGGQGCLGPGFHANATIGRAVNLVLINVCRSVPGVCDLDCLASQAEYSYCFAEDPSVSPWETINASLFDDDTTTVTVLKAEPPHDIIDFLSPTAADLLDTICASCSTLGSNNAYIPGPIVIVITPDHAQLFARDGYTKKMIQEHIHKYAFHPWSMVQNRGLRPVRPAGFDDMHPIPVTRSPEDVLVVVAGGKGGHSAVILPWALHSDAVTVPVEQH